MQDYTIYKAHKGKPNWLAALHNKSMLQGRPFQIIF